MYIITVVIVVFALGLKKKKTYEPVYAVISYVVIIAVAVPFPKIIRAPCKAAKHLGA